MNYSELKQVKRIRFRDIIFSFILICSGGKDEQTRDDETL